ncbi:MAG: glycerate kinase [Lentisphaeraceae bacterium]|nr:glycerate kinase [Lentisphaeraceae bacterium]
MKILLAFDSFKGSMHSPQVCEIVKNQLAAENPQWQIESLPLADGGEDTASILSDCLGGGMKISGGVEGPFPGTEILAGYGHLPAENAALVEMAGASGMKLVQTEELNPLKTSTFGTGQLIRHAIQERYSKIYLTLGGSATVDGGTGAAAALGWRFLNEEGKLLKPRGGNLLDIHSIVAPASLTFWPQIEALYDVTNPLLGENGATHVYAAQKGATPEMIPVLEDGLAHLADLIKTQLGKDVADVPGAGAAGGFGAGAMAFFNANLIPGTETILKWVDFAAKAKEADWIITGEGCLDDTSFQGKLISGICKDAKELDSKVAVIAGRVNCNGSALNEAGIAVAEACAPSMIPDEIAFAHSEELLREAVNRVAERIAADL